jgi:hypothetical protein
MSALTKELEQALRELDGHSAIALERLIRDAITLARPAKSNGTTELDAKGWPKGYFEKYAGCLAGDDWQPSVDPPPDLSQEP